MARAAKPEYKPNLTAEQILTASGISEQNYYWTLAISSDSDYELHLKRPPNSCFINNYFVAGIKAFAANVDLQPVFNHYKCITYICSYFSKDETECSQAISNAAKEATNSNLNVQESLRKIGAAFLSTREVSAQECVYRCMPELWLRNIFPKTLFVNTEFPQNRLRIPKSQDDLEESIEQSLNKMLMQCQKPLNYLEVMNSVTYTRMILLMIKKMLTYNVTGKMMCEMMDHSMNKILNILHIHRSLINHIMQL